LPINEDERPTGGQRSTRSKTNPAVEKTIENPERKGTHCPDVSLSPVLSLLRHPTRSDHGVCKRDRRTAVHHEQRAVAVQGTHQGRTIGSDSGEKAVEGKNWTKREALRPENRMETNKQKRFSVKKRKKTDEKKKSAKNGCLSHTPSDFPDDQPDPLYGPGTHAHAHARMHGPTTYSCARGATSGAALVSAVLRP
jgi:hypothetical protein